MSAWRKSGVTAVVVMALFLLVQLTIPISRFGDQERAARFGWQMFSVAVPAPNFVVSTPDGEFEIVLEDYMARVRGDVDIESKMPAHLCRVIDDARRVAWSTEVHECRAG